MAKSRAKPDTIDVWVMDVRQLEREDLYQNFYEKMPDSRKVKLDGFRYEADKRRGLGAGILLQRGLSKRGLTWTDDNVIMAEHGKLCLKAGGLQFNLSHSGNYAAAVFADTFVGIDIEQCGEAKLKIAKHFFREEEQELLAGIEDMAARDEMFFRLWTLKESFLKVNGLGMRLPLDSFAMHVTKKGVTVEEARDTGRYRFREYEVGKGGEEYYRIAVCARLREDEKIDFSTELQWMNLD